MKYSNLTPEEAVTIAMELGRRGIPYTLEVEEELMRRIRETAEEIADNICKEYGGDRK